MSRSFRVGVLAGLLAPLVYLAGVVAWVYHYTGKVPFPARRTDEDELVIRLVEPEEVRGYWQRWVEGLQPLVATLQRLGNRVQERLPRKGSPA